MDRKTYKKLFKKRYKVFGKVLKSIRKKQVHISQVALAERLGMDQSYVSKTETGERRLDIMELIAYSDAMGLCLTDFIFRLEWKLYEEGLTPPKRQEQIKKWLEIYKIYCTPSPPSKK